jgi:NitT/TauT family transport system substrate-binding protein
MSPRTTIAFLASIACLAFAAGCGPSGSTEPSSDAGAAAEPVKVKLQLNWVAEPEFGGFFAARDLGLYKSEGLEVEVIQGAADVPAPQLVATGKVEFATIAATQLVELNARGGELVALYAVYQTNPMGVMVHESSPFMTLKDAWESDATFAISDGLADYDWLRKRFPNGARKTVPYTGNNAQFAANPDIASQCFVPSEPTALATQGVKTRVFLIADEGFNPYNTVVVTTRAYFEKNRDVCARLVKASSRGWRAYMNDPKATNLAMARMNPAMLPEMMDKVVEVQRPLVENEDTKRLGLGGMLYARWDELAQQLVDLGKIPAKPDPQSLFFWDSATDSAR